LSICRRWAEGRVSTKADSAGMRVGSSFIDGRVKKVKLSRVRHRQSAVCIGIYVDGQGRVQ